MEKIRRDRIEAERFYINNVKDQEIYVEELQEDLQESILWYCQETNYKEFNENLRKENELTKEQTSNLDNLDKAFLKVPTLKNSITVYKGVKEDKAFTTDKAFMSTTIFFDKAKYFSNDTCCIYQITVSPNSKVLPIRKISTFPEEEEILLDRGGNLMLTGTDVKEDKKIFYITYSPKNSQEMKEDTNIDKLFLESEFLKVVRDRVEQEKDEDEDFQMPIEDIIKQLYKTITTKEISNQYLEKVKSQLTELKL